MEELVDREMAMLMAADGIDESSVFLILHPAASQGARGVAATRCARGGILRRSRRSRRSATCAARSRANKLAEDHRKRARERQEAAERLAARHAAERNAAMARRARAAGRATRRQASASAMAKAMAEAQKAKAAAEARSAADEAKSREWMRRVLETEEASRKVDMEKAAAAARAKTAHARWQAFRDTSAGMFDGDAFLCDSDDEEEEEEEAADADAGAPQAAVQEWVTEEMLQSRELKAAERDECVKRVLEKALASRLRLGSRSARAPTRL